MIFIFNVFYASLMLVLFASCGHNDLEAGNNTLQNNTTINLDIEHRNNLKTSSSTPEGYHFRYIVEIFEQQSDGTAGQRVERLTSVTPSLQTTALKQNKKYLIAAWADYVSSSNGIDDTSNDAAFYDASDLTNVQMKWSNWQVNNSALEAFSSTLSDFSLNNGTNVQLTLKRPVARLNIRSTEETSIFQKAGITSSEKIYTGYNLVTGDVTGTPQTLNLEGNTLSDNENLLAYTYIFARHLSDERNYQSGTMTIPLEITLYKTDTSAENVVVKKDFVPFSPNYITNFIITPTTTTTSISLEVNSSWETDVVDAKKTFIVQSYLRPWQYLEGKTTAQAIDQTNDLLFFAASPYANGEINFQTPENSASFSNVSFLNTYQGRTGVAVFEGNTNSYMNVGKSLIEDAKTNGKWTLGFTFSTWIYLDEWTNGAYIFEKNGNSKEVSLKLGENKGDFILTIDNFSTTLSLPNFTLNKWEHLTLVHNSTNNNSELYLNGSKVSATNNKTALPTTQSDMIIGKGLKGKLDETIIVGTTVGLWMINNPLKQGNLNTLGEYQRARVEAHWNYNNPNNRGEDLRSWVTILNNLRASLDPTKERKIRLGVHGGDWQAMMRTDESRTRFAQSLKQVIEKYNLDGVDFDFEWSYNATEFNNYNATILKVREILGSESIISVSLHPVSYKISQEAFDALDFINIQCYGPAIMRFAFDQYKKDAETVTQYFKNQKRKIILGVPFYGSHGNTSAGDPTTSYANLVEKGEPAVTKESTTATIDGKTYTFDGYNMIQKKTRYALDKEYLGVMSWDLVTDLPYTHELSLLRAMVEEVNKGDVQESPYRTDFE